MSVLPRYYARTYFEELREKSESSYYSVMGHLPFLDEAKSLLKEEGISVEAIVTAKYAFQEEKDHALWRIVNDLNIPKEAMSDMEPEMQRVVEAAERIERRPDSRGVKDRVDAAREVQSYLTARILLSCYPDESLINYFCRKEAERCKWFLAEYAKSKKGSGMERSLALAVGVELGLRIEDMGEIGLDDEGKEERYVGVHLCDFLMKGGELLKNPRYHLENFLVNKGLVIMEYKRFVRFMVEVIYLKMKEKLPAPVNDDIVAAFKDRVDIIARLLEVKRRYTMMEDMGDIKPYHIAPCIRDLRRALAEGINLSHFARLALATYYIKLNYDEDSLLSIFSEAPDFKEDMARYQIRHLMGQVGSTSYDPPSCKSMLSNGLCKPDLFCNEQRIRHPLNYFKLMRVIERAVKEALGLDAGAEMPSVDELKVKSDNILEHLKEAVPYFRPKFWTKERISAAFEQFLGYLSSYIELREQAIQRGT